MKYDFDKIYDRRNTDSLKYDFASERGLSPDVLPLWVADMDFRIPEEVISAIKKRADHGIFGYTEPKEDYYKTVCGWFEKRHGWSPDPHKFVITCSVVFSLCALLRAFTDRGDSVIICQPVYYPFEESIVKNGRKLVVSELKNDGGYYTVDFEDFEKKIVENKVKVFILCNPHNPVGRVWTRDELLKMGDICLKHGVFVISDEIHSDFVFGANRHTVFASLKEEFANNCAVCSAPTKTFNIAGLHAAHTYISCDERREKFLKELDGQGYSQPNIMGTVACKACYDYGESWLESLKVYLAENIAFVREYIAANLPQITLREPEGTYLVWLDCRRLGLDDKQLTGLVQSEAKLWLDDGYIFGKGGSGFQRINTACPRSVLKTALKRLKNAVERM